MKKLTNRTILLAAAFALALAVALALNAATQTPTTAQTPATPTPTPTATPASDTDGNGLIEISTPAQLNAMRWDLDGDGDQVGEGDPDASVSPADRLTYFSLLRCSQPTATGAGPTPSTCKGYELMADISLASYKPWTPIGARDSTGPWQAVFDGNGFKITGLEGANGLFVDIGTAATADKTIVKNVYVVGAKINRDSTHRLGSAGALAARNHGTIIGSYASGELESASAGGTGGLVGLNKGTIAGSVADVNVKVTNDNRYARIGGFVGVNNANIYGSYAYGDITDATPAGRLNARGFGVNNTNQGGRIYSSISYGDLILTQGDDNASNDVRTLADFSSVRLADSGRLTPNSCALSDESKFTCPTPTPTPTN